MTQSNYELIFSIILIAVIVFGAALLTVAVVDEFIHRLSNRKALKQFRELQARRKK